MTKEIQLSIFCVSVVSFVLLITMTGLLVWNSMQKPQVGQ